MMTSAIHEVLLGIRTVAQMVEVFRDEERCRRLVEARQTALEAGMVQFLRQLFASRKAGSLG